MSCAKHLWNGDYSMPGLRLIEEIWVKCALKTIKYFQAVIVSADWTLNQSVGDWLADLELSEYENMLVANGYDDMDFMVCLEISLLGSAVGL